MWISRAWFGMFKRRERVQGVGFAAGELRVRQGLRAGRRKTPGVMYVTSLSPSCFEQLVDCEVEWISYGEITEYFFTSSFIPFFFTSLSKSK